MNPAGGLRFSGLSSRYFYLGGLLDKLHVKADFVRIGAHKTAAEQLTNASDRDVLEVFARINTYTMALNAAELRHAEYQGDFKWQVHEAAQRWSTPVGGLRHRHRVPASTYGG